MLRAITLLTGLLLLPLSAQTGSATDRQLLHNAQYYAGLYLECGNTRDTARAVSLLTLAQLNSPDATVRFTRGLPRTCRAGNVTVQGYLQRTSSARTIDGWTVDVVDWVQSNGFPITFVDTSRAYIGRSQSRWSGQAVPRRRDRAHQPRHQRRNNDSNMTVQEGQEYLRQELKRLGR